MRYAMIMAGGAGKRLWPMSRLNRPKQLLPLFDGKSLLRLAAERIDGIVSGEHQYICTAESVRQAVRQAVPQFADDRILGEPTGRDTVNAIGLTAAVLAKHDADAVFAVLTADHIIEPVDQFAGALQRGFALVEDDASRLVTFSVTPTRPATEYGYVERDQAIAGFDGCFHAARFVEKPDAVTAQQYLDSRRFGWNSGMFIFHAATFLDALRRFEPASHAGMEQIAAAWGSPDQRSVLAAVYPTLPRTSVDYAIMERACADDAFAVCTVPMDIAWVDVGSWPSYAETLEADAAGNRSFARTVHLDSTRVLAVADDPEHTIATIGCDDLIIIRTADATLICRADRDQDVKTLVEKHIDDSLR